MVKTITISNFKTNSDISFDLGRINVLIGENGCGKTNILEAIAFGAAAASDKLDNEFLANRGIRLSDPNFMRSAFKKVNTTKEVKISFICEKNKIATYHLSNNNEPYSKWEEIVYVRTRGDNKNDEIELRPFEKNKLKTMFKSFSKDDKNIAIDDFLSKIIRDYGGSKVCKNYENFIIYSPENTQLMNFQMEGQIEPLGRRGEGLFKLLKSFFHDNDKSNISEIITLLKLFNWFDKIDLPSDLFEGENKLSIFDKFIYKNSKTLDQRSINEGFLFLLFYFALIISDKTPNFFAIENIETALNPKLCTKVIKLIVELSKKYSKQIIITTHNPSVLDGLNLDDNEQKLYCVYRNAEGHTRMNKINKPKPVTNEEPVKLSEAFIRGYIGGLPKNFSI